MLPADAVHPQWPLEDSIAPITAAALAAMLSILCSDPVGK